MDKCCANFSTTLAVLCLKKPINKGLCKSSYYNIKYKFITHIHKMIQRYKFQFNMSICSTTFVH
jgi:hypothetical protein